jgi:hypothetical protein
LPLSAEFVPQPAKPVSARANLPLLQQTILAHSNAARAYRPRNLLGRNSGRVADRLSLIGAAEKAFKSQDPARNNRFLRGNLLKIGRNPLVFGLFYAILAVPMAIQKKNAFSRRLPDLVTEELVTVLSQKKSFEFKQLFAIVHENLRQRNAASGGEEMLRLRAYEKLQNLVARGVVKKNGKIYKGDSGALAAMAAANAAQAAAIASKP